jgi:DNA-binding NarL/FixJ family response regulator
MKVNKEGVLRILVADHHEFVRRSIRDLLRAQKRWELVGEAASGKQAVEVARRLRPTVAIIDIDMPKFDGIEAARRILQSTPQTKILAMTVDRSGRMVRRALEAGARGYVLKSEIPNELVKAVRFIVQGGLFLAPGISQIVAHEFLNDTRPSKRLQARPTLRQRQIIGLLALGKASKEIAAALNISVRTVETHRAKIMLKFGFHSIADLVRYALRVGLVSGG